MSFDDELHGEHSLEELRERLLVAETANIALASILASLRETAHLDTEQVLHVCAQMCDMDRHLQDSTREFITNMLKISRDVHGLDEV